MQKAKRKYVKMFFEAQIITQELKKGNDNIDKQGHVYLYPESTLGQDNLTPYQTLTYLPYESSNAGGTTFKAKLAANAPDVQNYFSVNPQGQLVLAALVTTTVKVNSKTEGNLFDNNSTTTTYQATEVTIDYKNMISQYATPMSFYLELGMVTRNPEFLAAVVRLVKAKTNIQLTVLNTTSTNITVQVDEETKHIRGNSETSNSGTFDVPVEGIYPYSSDITTTTTTTTTVTTKAPSVKVTSVDTWICSQKITYNKIPGTLIEEEPYTIEQESEDAKSIDSNEIGEVSWITRKDSIVTTSSQMDTYDSGIASDYIDNTDEFIKLLDIEYKIPNSKEKRTAGAYLKTDAELFFQLLSQNPETQGMELVMRYIMQKYDNTKDYGAGDFSFNIFDVNYFNQMGGGGASPFGTNLTREEFISMAQAYSNSSDYINYMAKYAGDFYDICTKYNINPALAYAHACLETGNGSTSGCKNNKNYFGYAHYNDASSGKVYNSVQESIEDYCKWIIRNSTPGSGDYSANVKTAQEYATENAKLKGSPDNNIYVLYCRYAYLGDTHISDEPSFSSPAGKDYYMSHGSNWGTGGRIYIYYMYQEGGLYTGEYSTRCGHSKGSDPTTVAERADYAVYACNQRMNIAKAIFGNDCLLGSSGSLVEAAYEVAEHFMDGVTVHYAGSSNPDVPSNGRIVASYDIQASWNKPVENPNRYGVVCATYIGLSLWKAGLVDEETINQYNYNSCADLERMLTTSSYASQWQKITNPSELQEGDIVFISGHVYIYMNGGKCLDQNYCVITSRGEDYRGKLLSAKTSTFRAAYRYTGG